MEDPRKPYWTARRILLVSSAAAGIVTGIGFPVLCIPVLSASMAAAWASNRKLLLLCTFALLRVFYAGISEQEVYTGMILSQGENVCASMVVSRSPRALDARGFMVSCRLEEITRQDGTSASASGSIDIYVSSGDLPDHVSSGTSLITMLRQNGDRLYSSGSPLFSPPEGGLKEVLSRFRRAGRNWAAERLSSLPWEAGLLANSLLLGTPTVRGDDIFEACRTAGTSHVTALSGLHAAVLVHLLSLLLRPAAGKKSSRVICMVLLALYVWFIGPREGLVRAAGMYWIYSISLLRGIRPEGLEVLSLTALVHMVLLPKSVSSPSFLLSYGALAGIVLAARIIGDSLPAAVPPSVRGSAALTLSASYGSYPVLGMLGYGIYPAGIILSIPSIFLVTMFMYLALLYLVLPGIPGLGHLLHLTAERLVRMWEFGSALRTSPWFSPWLWISCGLALLTSLLCLQYRSCRSAYAKLSRSAVQFPFYDQGASGDAGSEYDQAVRSEFPDRSPCTQEDTGGAGC